MIPLTLVKLFIRYACVKTYDLKKFYSTGSSYAHSSFSYACKILYNTGLRKTYDLKMFYSSGSSYAQYSFTYACKILYNTGLCQNLRP
jgi:hypothetical protein